MKLAESRLTRQGQISVPAEVRRRLGLQPGSVLEWDAEGDTVVVRRVGRNSSEDIHRLLFTERPSRRSLAGLRDGVRDHVRRKHARG
jgi:AbrB family looped-hinge helix DNA binding protein